MKLPIKFNGFNCLIVKKRYNNNRVGLLLIDDTDGSPVCKATINIPELPLSDGYVFIKNHSENEGVLQSLYKHEVIDDMKIVNCGLEMVYKCRLLI